MVEEISKGNWAVRFYYKDCFGRRHRPYKSGFPTERAAKLWEAQEKARLEGEVVSRDKMTFAQLIKRWRESLVKKDASPKTLEKYDRYISYVAEYVNHLPLDSITEEMCQKLIDMHLTSPSTCVEIRKAMSAAFNYALKKRWMRENPFNFVDMPQYKAKKVEAYDFNDIRDLFAALKACNSKLYTPVLLACFFAATREEVCALQEVDFERCRDGRFRLNLDKALITTNGRAVIKGQKTENRRRSFLLSATVYNELHHFKAANGITSPFLCCNFNGGNIQPNTLSNAFADFIKAQGFKYTTFHKLRDAFANACKRLGVDLDTTYRMMGHSSYKVTAEYYATADVELTGAAVDRIERALFLDV